jgi:polar amino acid transport system substrate-binding protein
VIGRHEGLRADLDNIKRTGVVKGGCLPQLPYWSKTGEGGTWQDYKKPAVKVAVQAGTNEDLVARLPAPLAQHLAHNMQSEAQLAVGADRADAIIATDINGIFAKSKNPQLGAFVTPTPLLSFPSYFGVRNKPDRRFETFQFW